MEQGKIGEQRYEKRETDLLDRGQTTTNDSSPFLIKLYHIPRSSSYDASNLLSIFDISFDRYFHPLFTRQPWKRIVWIRWNVRGYGRALFYDSGCPFLRGQPGWDADVSWNARRCIRITVDRELDTRLMPGCIVACSLFLTPEKHCPPIGFFSTIEKYRQVIIIIYKERTRSLQYFSSPSTCTHEVESSTGVLQVESHYLLLTTAT